MRRPVLVKWRDAYAIDETWLAEGDKIADPVIVSTVGYVIDGPKGYLTIADSVYNTASGRYFGGVTVIPAGMVVERRKL